MGHLSRTPTSNDPSSQKKYPWLDENELMDATALLLAKKARRCRTCKRPISNRYLDSDQRCPDCRS